MTNPTEPPPQRWPIPLLTLAADAMTDIDRLHLRAINLERLVVRLVELDNAGLLEHESRLTAPELELLAACQDVVYGLVGQPIPAEPPLAGDRDEPPAAATG